MDGSVKNGGGRLLVPIAPQPTSETLIGAVVAQSGWNPKRHQKCMFANAALERPIIPYSKCCQ